jgi:hypothetical protein
LFIISTTTTTTTTTTTGPAYFLQAKDRSLLATVKRNYDFIPNAVLIL